MFAEEKDGRVVLSGVKDFDLTQTFTCGQCFRWIPENGGYTGVAFGKALHITQNGNEVTLHDSTLQDYESLWRKYFHLNYNYEAVKKTLSADPILKKAADFGGGIRLLSQDAWECIVSFIISANIIFRAYKKLSVRCAVSLEIRLNTAVKHIIHSPTHKLWQGFRAKI